MPYNIFSTIIELEQKFARFYSRLATVSRFKAFSETFKLMETVSLVHSESIKEISTNHTEPVFNKKAVYSILEKLERSLWDEITKEENENNVIEKLAVNEENVGKLYKAISAYFLKLSDHYKNISSEIHRIANEEFDHRDALRKIKNR